MTATLRAEAIAAQRAQIERWTDELARAAVDLVELVEGEQPIALVAAEVSRLTSAIDGCRQVLDVHAGRLLRLLGTDPSGERRTA